MAQPIRTENIPGHADRKARAKKNAKRRDQKKAMENDFSDRTFDDLNGNERNQLLKIVALELGLIAPDP